MESREGLGKKISQRISHCLLVANAPSHEKGSAVSRQRRCMLQTAQRGGEKAVESRGGFDAQRHPIRESNLEGI